MHFWHISAKIQPKNLYNISIRGWVGDGCTFSSFVGSAVGAGDAGEATAFSRKIFLNKIG